MTTTSKSTTRIAAIPATKFEDFPRLTRLAVVGGLILERFGDGAEWGAWLSIIEGESVRVARRWDASVARDMVAEAYWFRVHRKALAWLEVAK